MTNLIFKIAAFYLRNTSIGFGRYRLLKLARPIGRTIGKEIRKKKIRTKHGFKMELDLKDWIPQDIYLTGEFESTTSTIVKRLLKPGDNAIDVGANIGYFSLLFSQCIGNSGTVFSFEPAPQNLLNLEKNINLNHCKNIITSNIALSDQSGTTQFHLGPEDNTGLSSLRKPRDSVSTIEVDLKSFDELEFSTNTATLVKIDVEGAELRVLRGMENFIVTNKPYILLEITDAFLKELGDSEYKLYDFLNNLGYYCYMIEDGYITLMDNPQESKVKQWNALFAQTDLFGKSLKLT